MMPRGGLRGYCRSRPISRRCDSSKCSTARRRRWRQSGGSPAASRYDFNNLLTAIIGTTSLVLEDMGLESRARLDIQEIEKAAKRAAGLTRQLLIFSRQQVLEPRALDLNALVANLEKMLHRLIGADIELRTKQA